MKDFILISFIGYLFYLSVIQLYEYFKRKEEKRRLIIFEKILRKDLPYLSDGYIKNRLEKLFKELTTHYSKKKELEYNILLKEYSCRQKN